MEPTSMPKYVKNRCEDKYPKMMKVMETHVFRMSNIMQLRHAVVKKEASVCKVSGNSSKNIKSETERPPEIHEQKRNQFDVRKNGAKDIDNLHLWSPKRNPK